MGIEQSVGKENLKKRRRRRRRCGRRKPRGKGDKDAGRKKPSNGERQTRPKKRKRLFRRGKTRGRRHLA